MRVKDLKINFRYLGGNIACLSVDSITGESIHNDINNEEAIIIFNSLVGEKADCQTVKTLLKENKELKKQVEDLFSENRNLRKKLENCMTFEDYKYTLNKKIKLETQQKEFIKYLENYMKQMVDDYGSFKYDKTSVTSGEYKAYKEILQKYKEIIGVLNEKEN